MALSSSYRRVLWKIKPSYMWLHTRQSFKSSEASPLILCSRVGMARHSHPLIGPSLPILGLLLLWVL